MDTEFPRVILHPISSFKTTSDYHHQTLRSNVDLLKPIQLGLTFSDPNLNHHFVFQFNFREFDPQSDVYASGIDFEKNLEFEELLMSSGVVLNDAVQWIAFHSGYDFSYLLKIMTCKSLPESQEGFFDLIRTYFPRVYDIKHLMRFCNSLHGGLDKLAELIELERIGICHQEGSDSLLTACAFGKDGEIERLLVELVELAELHKGRRKLLELVNMKEN